MSVEPVTYGQGSYGYRCTVCGHDDYDTGRITHTCGSTEQGRRWVDDRPFRVFKVTKPDGQVVLAGTQETDEHNLRVRFGPNALLEDVTPEAR